jgi:DNA-binding transcriptional LysR family regulator
MDTLNERQGLSGERQDMSAAIIRIRYALDEAACLQSVKQANERNWPDAENSGEGGLIGPFVLRQLYENSASSECHARELGAQRAVVATASQPGCLEQQPHNHIWILRARIILGPRRRSGRRGLLQQTADGRFVRPVILNARHRFFFSFDGAASARMSMQIGKENPISIAFSIERDSAMDRGDLANLSAFVTVADQRSFRAAASRLDVTPSALSHSMRQLEARLGVRLLNRTTRSVSVTDAGQRLLEQLRPALGQISDALEDLNRERSRPFGRLRIYATNMAGAGVIAPVWQRFLSTYPEVHLELQLGEAPVDIVAKGFDAGVGPQDRAAADMVAVRVTGPLKVAVVGAPSYFARRPRPRIPDDLARHSCVQYRRGIDGEVFEWPFERNGKSQKISVDGRVMVNNPDLAVRAAVDGLGVAFMIEASAEPFLRSGQLVRVLEDWSPTIEGLFLYYPGRRQVPAALRALIDMIRTSSSRPARSSLQNPFAEH